jgi:hypothetical protein
VNILLAEHTEDIEENIKNVADLIEVSFRQAQLSAQSEQWQLAIKDIKKLYIKDVPSVSININSDNNWAHDTVDSKSFTGAEKNLNNQRSKHIHLRYHHIRD